MATCSSCGQTNPEGFRFCGGCGAPLAPAELREERKVVSVLFADLVGFTGRSERLDPEDVRATLSPYYARLRHEIERFGGTIEKFIGDAVMALFGAPTAHEDDPERAVRAALAIRDALAELNESEPGFGLQVRLAVTTGEALVALGARVAEGEGMASGDVVNTAARLQAAAPVNGILVSEATYRATRDVVDYRAADPVDAKGKSEPVPVWEAVGARSRFGIDVAERSLSALVGRERELVFLREALGRCRTERAPQLVTLVGVPGIGKSRLVSELMNVVDADPELIWWRQGRSLPYGEGLSYWALGEIVKAQAGILENDPLDEAARKLRAMIDDLVKDRGAAAWVEGHVRPLVGLDIGEASSGDRRNEAFSAWRRLLESLAEQRPLVLVFEDLHWADEGLLDFVDYVADWASGVAILIVGTARPELLERRPGWGGGKRNSVTMSIASLSSQETAALLAARLEQALLPAEVQSKVLAVADGNPLYTEEYVRMLQDRGFLVHGPGGWRLDAAEQLPLPESVQGTIAARLDALPLKEKELLQDAAVLGKVFWPGALATLAGGSPFELEHLLHGLERKEFIRRERRSAVAGEEQYAFLHALVRDVGYGQIPRPRRVEKHRLAAEWIESLAGDRSEDRAEMLAHHYLEAIAISRSANLDLEPLRAPAVIALLEASSRATALNAWPAAADFARSAIDLMAESDRRRPDAMFSLLNATWMLGETEVELGLETRDSLLAAGDTESAAETDALLSRLFWLRGDRRKTDEHAANALALVEPLPDSLAKARVVAWTARRAELGGDWSGGRALAQRALAIAEQIGDAAVSSHALNTMGMARVHGGDADGIDDLRRSVELAETAGSPHELHTALNNLANMHWRLGQLDQATDRLEQARQACERFGYDAGLRWLLAEKMLDHTLRGDWNEALAVAEQVLAAEDDVLRYLHIPALTVRAQIRLARGQLEDALADSALALLRGREAQDAQQLGPTILRRAEVLVAAGRGLEAEALLDELIQDADLADCWLHELPLLLASIDRGGKYLAALDRYQLQTPWLAAGAGAARGAFQEAAAAYALIGAKAAEAKTRLLAADALIAEGRSAQAGSELERALSYFRAIGATASITRCEALLPASA